MKRTLAHILLFLLLTLNAVFADIGEIKYSSELSSKFHSNPQINYLKSDKECLGYFGNAGCPGRARYVAIYSENMTHFTLNFIEYNYNSESLETIYGVSISDELAKNLLSLLKNQIEGKIHNVTFGFDGISYEFGIRKGAIFDCAGVWSPKKDSIAYKMGRISNAKNETEVKFMLSRINDMLCSVPNNKFTSLKLSKDAILKLAEIYLLEIYGDKVLQQKPWIMTDNDDNYIVKGRLPPQFTLGGVAEIEIRKSDGKVVRYSHGK